MAIHSSTLALKLPWTEEPGRLQFMGSLRVGHDWATSLSPFTFMHWRRKWQPAAVSCLENPRDRGAWWAAVYGVAQSWTWLNWLSSSSSTHIIWEVTPSEAPLYLASSFPSGRTSDYTRDKTLVRLSVDTSFHLVKCLNPSQILT